MYCRLGYIAGPQNFVARFARTLAPIFKIVALPWPPCYHYYWRVFTWPPTFQMLPPHMKSHSSTRYKYNILSFTRRSCTYSYTAAYKVKFTPVCDGLVITPKHEEHCSINRVQVVANIQSQKTIHLIFDHNFSKCRPIFKILTPIISKETFCVNTTKYNNRVFHLTLRVLLHYGTLQNSEISNNGWSFTDTIKIIVFFLLESWNVTKVNNI